MPRKSQTQQLTESIAGQHLALAVAAHLARTQLALDPLKVHDAQNLSGMLDLVAIALARTAPLYIVNADGQERQLTPTELEGAVASRGATALLLKDGRTLEGVSIRRSDLRQAVAILKAIGLHEIAPQFVVAEPPPAEAKQGRNAGQEAMIVRLVEIEAALTQPLLASQVDKAKRAALFIARHAPHGRVANLAMQLMSSLHESHGTDDVPGGYRMALARLRAAIEEQNG